MNSINPRTHTNLPLIVHCNTVEWLNIQVGPLFDIDQF